MISSRSDARPITDPGRSLRPLIGLSAGTTIPSDAKLYASYTTEPGCPALAICSTCAESSITYSASPVSRNATYGIVVSELSRLTSTPLVS